MGVKSYLAGQRPTNWGHHLYHSKVDGDFSHDRHKHINTGIMSPRAYGLTSLSEKTRILEQRQHLLLNYFKILSVGSAGNRTQASRTIGWRLTNLANKMAVCWRIRNCFARLFSNEFTLQRFHYLQKHSCFLSGITQSLKIWYRFNFYADNW